MNELLLRIADEFDKVAAYEAAARYRRLAKSALPASSDTTRSANPELGGTLERKLVELLSDGAKDKFEIIQCLYGKCTDLVRGENRLKNLLHRLKRKRPHAIIFSGGRYRIAFSAGNILDSS